MMEHIGLLIGWSKAMATFTFQYGKDEQGGQGFILRGADRFTVIDASAQSAYLFAHDILEHRCNGRTRSGYQQFEVMALGAIIWFRIDSGYYNSRRKYLEFNNLISDFVNICVESYHNHWEFPPIKKFRHTDVSEYKIDVTEMRRQCWGCEIPGEYFDKWFTSIVGWLHYGYSRTKTLFPDRGHAVDLFRRVEEAIVELRLEEFRDFRINVNYQTGKVTTKLAPYYD